MNYLQLVQAVHRLLRADNNQLGAAPATVVGQSGLLDELVFFVDRAWQDIQSENTPWLFMVKETTLQLPANSDIANPFSIADYDRVVLAESDGRNRFITMYRDSVADEITVRFIPYAAWQQSYLERGQRSPGQPGSFTILPDGRFRFDLVADVAYTLKLVYRRTNQSLVEDTDVPILPARHSMAIVWWAIANYYCTTRDGAEGLRQRAMIQLRREMQKLNNAQSADPILHEGSI